MNYVYSTLSSDQNYVERGKNRQVVSSVFVAGQANIPNKHMLTPRGVSTQVSDEQLQVLRNNRVFKLHEKNGFISVDTRKQDPDKAARNMSTRDKSSPDTEEKLSEMRKEQPKSNKRG